MLSDRPLISFFLKYRSTDEIFSDPITCLGIITEGEFGDDFVDVGFASGFGLAWWVHHDAQFCGLEVPLLMLFISELYRETEWCNSICIELSFKRDVREALVSNQTRKETRSFVFGTHVELDHIDGTPRELRGDPVPFIDGSVVTEPP